MNGLGEVRVGAEGEAALDVLLGAQRRDDEQRRRPVVLRLADEAHELEAVDVGHVDVGDDEVVGPARQEAHRVEAAAAPRRPRTPPCAAANSGASSTARTNARADTESSTTRTLRMRLATTATPIAGAQRPKSVAGARSRAPWLGTRRMHRTPAHAPPRSSSATRSSRARSRRRTWPSSRASFARLGVLLQRVVVVIDDVDTIAREVRELSTAARLALHERRRRARRTTT